MNKLLITLSLVLLTSCNHKHSSVFFPNLKDGQKISSPFKLQMGVEGMQVKPAGEIVQGTGHHHLIVDGSFLKKGTAVPADATHIHFGKGQTEYDLNLSPGKHTLTLQFADGAHRSYGQELSKTISVTVE